MSLPFFLKGLALGLAIAAPVGPIGILCIRRTLAEGRMMGLAVGLGAAVADASYGCIAGFGLTAISSFLVGQSRWLGFAGGLFLCYLGVRTYRSPPSMPVARTDRSGQWSAFLSTAFLTFTNPMTILSFVAVFAGLGLGASPNYLAAGFLVAGVFLGSALWWLMLSTGVAWFQSRVNSTWMRSINRCSGILILAFGLYSLLGALVVY